MAELFLDASYAIALASRSDLHHARAVELAAWIEEKQITLITTRAVMLEIGNALSKQRHRSAGVTLLRAIEQDAKIEVVPLSEALYAQAFALYERRTDKEWGLTDCVSFVVMSERGIQEALTTDTHFRQASFRALLLSDSPP